MKEDKDLLKELLQTKFEDDTIESSRDNFDYIFDAVQEKSDDKSLFLWYTVGAILIILISVVTLFFVLRNKTTNTSTEIPVIKESIDLITKTNDEITSIENKENYTTTIDSTEIKEDIKQFKKDEISKPVDVTTLEPKDEIIEKGVITVTYKASEKYASTEYTKYNKLPDSSTIVVRKNSNINFTASKQGYRRADVTGTIFLNIKKDESKPFILFGKYCKIQITGNSFAIHSDAKADLMTLINGTAKVVHNSTREVRDLIPGESFRVDQKGIYLLEKPPNQFAFKTGNLYYKDSSVQQIINDLGENYDAKILLKNATILNCKYSGVFEEATTAKVLKKVVLSLKLQVAEKDGIFIITGQGCSE